MEIIPLGDRIVVKHHNSSTKTAGGIYTPEKDKAAECTVLSVGTLVEKVKVGDICILSTYSGARCFNPLRPETKDWSVIHEEDILAIIKYDEKERKYLGL